MTVLTLTKGWLLRVTTGETFGAQTAAADRAAKFGIEGGIVNHAGGRQRAYSVEGESGAFERTFLELTLAQVLLLRSWEGELVFYRDHRPGLALYGTFFEVQPVERPEPNVYNAKITLNLLSFTAGV